MGHPLATCLGDLRPFHQFTVNISIEKKPKMVGLASEAIMIASEGSRHLFIDGTCRFVPLGFYQFLVLMIYTSQACIWPFLFFPSSYQTPS